MPALVRRVSFSNRVFYSDDASVTTVSTDDDLSLNSSDDESAGDNNPKATDTVAMVDKVKECAAKAKLTHDAIREETPTKTPNESTILSDTEKEDELSMAKLSWQSLVKEEPALVFRDNGVVHRPDEYLGGFSEDIPTQKVKFRKSWLLNDNESEEYNEFEEWKKSRAPNKDEGDDGKEEIILEESLKDEASGREAVAKNQKEEDTVMIPADKTKAPELIEDHGVSDKKGSVTKYEQDSNSILAAYNAPNKKGTAKWDKEMYAHEKEVLEIKDNIARLQRKLDVAEVRNISNLADLEEETAKRMREHREKANIRARKKRAKEEKNDLKQQAMKSQDLIEHLRRSNQKMRSEGIKTQSAITELRKSNQALEEQNSFHRDYASQFQNFQKIEVKLAEQMNLSLKKDMPKYASLVRGMEEAVNDREKRCFVENRSKEIYEDCMQSLLDVVTEHCHDDGLVEKIASLTKVSDVEIPVAIDGGDGARSPSAKFAKRRSSNSRSTSHTIGSGGTLRPTRPSKSIHRSWSSGFQNGIRRGSESGYSSPRKKSLSTRGNRSPTSVVSGNKNGSSDDDSSTCSITSVQSDTISLGGYIVDNY